jgi:serine/threonine protein kinase HipA of HipAB toxin-antitoxin module
MMLEKYAHRPPADIERIVGRAVARWLIRSLRRWLRQMRRA